MPSPTNSYYSVVKRGQNAKSVQKVGISRTYTHIAGEWYQILENLCQDTDLMFNFEKTMYNELLKIGKTMKFTMKLHHINAEKIMSAQWIQIQIGKQQSLQWNCNILIALKRSYLFNEVRFTTRKKEWSLWWNDYINYVETIFFAQWICI